MLSELFLFLVALPGHDSDSRIWGRRHVARCVEMRSNWLRTIESLAIATQ